MKKFLVRNLELGIFEKIPSLTRKKNTDPYKVLSDLRVLWLADSVGWRICIVVLTYFQSLAKETFIIPKQLSALV